MVMAANITKTTFKAQALAHFRRVLTDKKPVIIMDKGKPVLKVIPYTENKQDELKSFRGLLRKYVRPTKPVLDGEWTSLL